MLLPLRLPAGHGIQTDGVDAVENALFDIGVIALELPEQLLDLLPLGAAAVVAGLGLAMQLSVNRQAH